MSNMRFTGALECRSFEILPETFVHVTGKERITIEHLIEQRVAISLGKFEQMENAERKLENLCEAVKTYFEKLNTICECSLIPLFEDLMREEQEYQLAENDLKKLVGLI